MKRIENRYALAVIYLLLTAYAIFSVTPFFWTTIQSFKTPRQANSRVPLFIFEPTADNYTDLWLKAIPDDPFFVAIVLVAIFGLLVLVAINARRLPGSARLCLPWRARRRICRPVVNPSLYKNADFLRLLP